MYHNHKTPLTYKHTLPCLIVGGSNRLKWVAFSENNRPKTKNYNTRSYKIIPKPEFTPPPPPPPTIRKGGEYVINHCRENNLTHFERY